MDKEQFKKRMAAIPQRVADSLDHRQKRVVSNYQTQAKLTSVVRWRQRMAKAGIKVNDVAAAIEKPQSRISEWLNFVVEPTEDNFIAVENAIYNLGG